MLRRNCSCIGVECVGVMVGQKHRPCPKASAGLAVVCKTSDGAGRTGRHPMVCPMSMSIQHLNFQAVSV